MSRKSNQKPIYAFIDGQNLNLGTSKDVHRNKKLIHQGWKIDTHKFMTYLKHKFRVTKAFYFIGMVESNEDLYQSLRTAGYELVFKPTISDDEGKPKGNVDAELVLHAAAIEYPNYHKAVIVSGDGDFACLHQFLVKHNKLERLIIPNRYSESSLLAPYQKYKTILNREKSKLEYVSNKKGGRRS